MPGSDLDAYLRIAHAWNQPGVGSRTVSKMMDGLLPLPEVPAAELAKLRHGLAALPFEWGFARRHSEAYPADLERLPHPPAGICWRGELGLLARPSLAIVGTRKPTEDGRRRARKLAQACASQGLVVVSGLAAGIDTEALTAAMDAGAKVVAVIGTPLDKAYPAENTQLQERIAREGLLISQFPFGVKVDRGNFPERNHTMAAVSSATCVVEAGSTSGTAHQVDACLRIGKPALFLRSMVATPAEWVSKALERGAKVLAEPSELAYLVGSGR